MRFCMVTSFFPPYSLGGDGIAVWRLSNALARRGHRIDVVHCADAFALLSRSGPKGLYPNHPNVTVHTLRSRTGPLSPLVTQQTGLPGMKAGPLRDIIGSSRFDVLHFHNMSLIGPAALAYGSPQVIRLYTTHEHWLVCPMHVLWQYDRQVCEHPKCWSCQLAGRRPPQLWRHTPKFGHWLSHVDAFIAPSRFTLRMHVERSRRWGLPELPFTHIPHFLPNQEVDRGGAAATMAVPQKVASRPYFLFVGRLERIKGLQNVIDVFRSYDRADLLIAGEGDHGSELRAQAAGLPHVRFLGRRSQSELRALYEGAVAALVPSICYEVFGLVVIEAFAMGTPVIAHDLGALPEIIAESNGGLVYRTPMELMEAMDGLQRDPCWRRRLGEAGHSAYRRLWTEDAHMTAYAALLHEIAGRRGTKLPDLHDDEQAATETAVDRASR